MTSLNHEQKELIFSYCLGITTEVEKAQAEEFIFANEDAAKLAASIKKSLSPLDTITPEQCPEELADGTVWRAMQQVRTSSLKLNQLIAAEQKPREGFWRDIFGRLATAAVFMIVGIIVFGGGKAGLNYARQKSWQTKCGAQLAGLFTGLSNYKADNNGQMPILSIKPGTPWFRVGDQGPENVSNTRRMWILVRNDYVKPDDFMCPARKDEFSCHNPRDYNDFPKRNYVTYSFRISCPKSAGINAGRQVIISDKSPVFEQALCSPPSNKKFLVNLTDELLNRNSSNHAGRGQNVLFCDGSVTFIRKRHVNSSMDDIFTIQGRKTYTGTEMPESDLDAFLAP